MRLEEIGRFGERGLAVNIVCEDADSDRSNVYIVCRFSIVKLAEFVEYCYTAQDREDSNGNGPWKSNTSHR